MAVKVRAVWSICKCFRSLRAVHALLNMACVPLPQSGAIPFHFPPRWLRFDLERRLGVPTTFWLRRDVFSFELPLNQLRYLFQGPYIVHLPFEDLPVNRLLFQSPGKEDGSVRLEGYDFSPTRQPPGFQLLCGFDQFSLKGKCERSRPVLYGKGFHIAKLISKRSANYFLFRISKIYLAPCTTIIPEFSFVNACPAGVITI